jgi:hypothetical protein
LLELDQKEANGAGFSPWQVAAPPVEKNRSGHGVGSDEFPGHMDPAGQRYMLLLAQNDPAGQTVQASCEL